MSDLPVDGEALDDDIADPPCLRCNGLDHWSDQCPTLTSPSAPPPEELAEKEQGPALDLDAPCEHLDFDAYVAVQRLSDEDGGPINAYAAEITVHCVACAEPFVWIGVDPGMSPREPRISIDATVLNAPLRPQTSPEDFGLPGPGFDVRRIL